MKDNRSTYKSRAETCSETADDCRRNTAQALHVHRLKSYLQEPMGPLWEEAYADIICNTTPHETV